MTIDTTSVLLSCVGGAGMLIALAVGWHFGVKAAFATLRDIARRKLNDAEHAEFSRMLDKIREAQ
jgi:hypothetical protein